jgi:hypothetical protein
MIRWGAWRTSAWKGSDVTGLPSHTWTTPVLRTRNTVGNASTRVSASHMSHSPTLAVSSRTRVRTCMGDKVCSELFPRCSSAMVCRTLATAPGQCMHDFFAAMTNTALSGVHNTCSAWLTTSLVWRLRAAKTDVKNAALLDSLPLLDTPCERLRPPCLARELLQASECICKPRDACLEGVIAPRRDGNTPVTRRNHG